ncbi:MAG: hypothetical protein WBD30_03835 [Bacteroidota bacterium]
MKRRTFFGRVAGGFAAFFLGQKIAAGETPGPRKPDPEHRITVRANPLAVSRRKEKPRSHG